MIICTYTYIAVAKEVVVQHGFPVKVVQIRSLVLMVSPPRTSGEDDRARVRSDTPKSIFRQIRWRGERRGGEEQEEEGISRNRVQIDYCS
jgi:hypothetical protein